jgi:hypothetical protein
MRGLKEDATVILQGYQLYHNNIRPYEAIDGKKPSEACGITTKGKQMENANSKCEYERLGRHFFNHTFLKKDIRSTLLFYPKNGLHSLLRERECRVGARFGEAETMDHPQEA